MAFDLIEDCKLLKYYLDKGDDVSYINKCKKIELELRESREKIYIKRQSFGKGIPRVIWKIIFLFLGNEHWGHETVCKTWKQFFDLENPKKIYKKLKSHDNKRRHKLYSCQGNVVHEDYDGYVYHLTDDLNTRRKIGSFPKDFYFTGKEIVYKLPFLNWTFFYFCDIHTLHTTKCSFDSTYNGSFFVR